MSSEILEPWFKAPFALVSVQSLRRMVSEIFQRTNTSTDKSTSQTKARIMIQAVVAGHWKSVPKCGQGDAPKETVRTRKNIGNDSMAMALVHKSL